MKRLATYTQHKILRHFWMEHTPFTVNDLVKKGILHIPTLGRLTLRLMESRGQILFSGKRNGEPLYIATTESKNEWADIWRRIYDPLYLRKCFGGSMRGMNWYEREDLFAELDDLIETYRKSNHI